MSKKLKIHDGNTPGEVFEVKLEYPKPKVATMNDIWHKADKTPEEDRVIVVKSKRTGEYLVGSEFEFILDNFTKWAYFDDLLALETELERTRKALDKAKWWLHEIIENHRFTLISTAEMALKEITALEQKD